ncbi:MAG: carboxypeptidase-like regulatory domain-containing protein [Bacteroidales bacterium]|jgi:hypothetical protein|nr:carboxypeptidase-like regulatory domain-containing protein [Bacteroidales bacterium]MCI2122508.1 carboxypeptidase-like regulatory domain-containing protein [Bacteroidales bacterium]MCI2144789.1 carboxypeptidase-like regulatory domain-containing protein [Bacteroidales bacterium]
MRTKRLIPILLAAMLGIATGTSVAAQNDAYLEIAGKTVDSRSGKSLAYASISLTGSNISIVTNSEGFFTLKVPESVSNFDSVFVKISFLGYSSEEIPISDFKGSSVERPLLIKLMSISLKLDPSIVKPYDAESVFDEAFYRTKENYPQENVSMTGFYREMIMKGSKYLALNEAVVDISKASYGGFRNDRVGIFKGRGSQNYDSSDTLFINFQGGPVSALNVDVVKNPFLGVYLKDVHTYYDMEFSGRVVMNDRTFYVISFSQKRTTLTKDNILFRGDIYIDTETFAVGRIEFYQNVEGEDNAVRMFIKSKPANTRITVDQAHYIINYKLSSDGKWYLDYDKMELKFTARRKHSIWRNHFYIKAELAVTDHKPGNFNINPENRLKMRDVLSKKVSSFTDDDFWGSYNIIQPDQSIDKVIGKIIKQLKKREAEK